MTPSVWFGHALSLADLEPRETGDGDARGGEHLADRGLRVLHERLLNQRDVLEERADAALHDLRDGLLRLALVAGDLLRDPALLLHDFGGDLVAGHILRAHRRDLLGEVLGRVLALLVQLDQHTEGRRQCRVAAVQVAGHVAALEPGEPAEFQLLLQAGAGLLDQLGDRDAGLGLGLEQRRLVLRLGRDGRLRDVGGDLLEQVGLRDEVGLAVQLHKDARAGAVELGRDQAIPGRPGGALARVLGALHAEQLDRCLEVTIGLLQCVLAVHHPGAGLVPEPLHVSGGVVRHVLYLFCSGMCSCAWFVALWSLRRGRYACSAASSAASTAASGVAASAAAFASASACAASAAASAGPSGVSVSVASGVATCGVAASGVAASGVAASGVAACAVAASGVVASASPAPTSSSRSHSASGSSAPTPACPVGFSSPLAAPARAIRPTASATTLVSSATLRIASSLPGIG